MARRYCGKLTIDVIQTGTQTYSVRVSVSFGRARGPTILTWRKLLVSDEEADGKPLEVQYDMIARKAVVSALAKPEVSRCLDCEWSCGTGKCRFCYRPCDKCNGTGQRLDPPEGFGEACRKAMDMHADGRPAIRRHKRPKGGG